MSLALVAIVLAIGAGAVIAVSTREAAAAALGLAVALVASALLSDPLPSATILGVRIVAALLAAALIRWAVHGGPRQYSPLGWPAEALLATAAAVAGLGIAVGVASITTTIDSPPSDAGLLTAMALTLAAATILFVIGVAPLVHGRPGIRRAIGRVLVTQAVLLLRIGLAGPPNELEEIARAALLVAVAASGSALVRATAIAHTNVDAVDDPDDDGADVVPRRPGLSSPRASSMR